MWLDRLMSPSGQESRERQANRTPLLRANKAGRPSQNNYQPRPTLNERSSSLNTSLDSRFDKSPHAVQQANSVSKIKVELAGDIKEDASDTILELDVILGQWQDYEIQIPGRVNSTTTTSTARDQPTLASSRSIASNAIAVDTPEGSETYNKGIQGLGIESARFQDLHQSIKSCDETLKAVELYLDSFRLELSAVSAEIEDLQERSTTMNERLTNRRAVQMTLGPAVDQLVIPPASVRKLVQGKFDDVWIKSLQDIQKSELIVSEKLRKESQDENLGNISLFMSQLTNKLVERVRDYVVSQIKALRHPNIDAHIIQQRDILPYQLGFAYLAQRQQQLSIEISQAYVATMSWYYSSHFTRYKASLGGLAIRQIDYTDAMADDNHFRRSPNIMGAQDIFSLGRRTDILRSQDIGPLPAFAADEDKGSHFMELPFFAFNVAFIENAISEYTFLSRFFLDQTIATTNFRFKTVFKDTSSHGYALTRQLIEKSTDAVGVLICIRLTQGLAFKLQQHKMPALDDYINGTNMELWPRFQMIIDAHCTAIRKATSILPARPTGTSLTLTAAASPILTSAPHALTQRLAIFVHSILSLSVESGDDEPIAASLRRLLAEYDAFILKLSRGLADTRRRNRLLYNNYSLVRTIFTDLNGRLAQDVKMRVDDMCQALQQEQ